MTITDLLCRHAVGVFDKQLHLYDLIDDEDWQFDANSGLLSFGRDINWSAGIIGTESVASATWQWSWAKHSANISEELLTHSRTMREFGEEENIPELISPELPLGRINGHILAMISTGFCQASAYYKAPYEGGAVFLIVDDFDYPYLKPDEPLARIASVFPRAIASFDIPNHRLAFIGYLEFYGLNAKNDGDKIMVGEEGKFVVSAAFDDKDRLITMKTTFDS